MLLDDARPEYLGGQFVHAVIASLDWAGMLEFFRTGQPVHERPDRYRVSIERLTVQDVAVFFQEALAELPQARRGPVARRPRRRHPLRRGSMADRDGPAVSDPGAGRPGVRAGFSRPGSRQRGGRRAGGPDRDPAGPPRAGRRRGRVRPRVLPVRPAPARRSGGRPARGLGGVSAQAVAWSCSIGRCRPVSTSSGRARAS